MKKKNRKPKTCQWLEGFQGKGVSSWRTCKTPAMFEVQQFGVTLAHVCAQHSISATQLGHQIR